MATRTRRSLIRQAAFWDSSALVPLCVRQLATEQSVAWFRAFEVIVWWATPVEINSALARLLRIQQLNSSQWLQSIKRAQVLAETWSVIEPANFIRVKAVDLVEHYDLRAGDALQIAAALQWCEVAPQRRMFLTADKRLQDVARLLGFSV